MDALWREADLVIALGSRLEETATFGWPEDAAQLLVIQAVLGEESLTMERPGAHVLGDAGRIVDGWAELLAGHRPAEAWPARVRAARAALVQRAADRAEEAAKTVADGAVPVARVLAALDRAVPADRVLVQENGLQDMWSYFFPHWSLGSGGGSVVPVSYTRIRDGAFNLFRSELPTVADAGAAVLYVVLDNGGYGWLQSNLDRVSGTHSRFAFTRPRPTGTEGLTSAYGLGYRRVTDADELAGALADGWRQVAAGTTTVVEVATALADTPPGMTASAGDFPEREGHQPDGAP